MTKELEIINRYILEGRVREAILQLEAMVGRGDTCDETYFMLGKAYAKMGDWRRATYNYNAAIELNPDSPAAEALTQIKEIMDFYNTDLYNP